MSDISISSKASVPVADAPNLMPFHIAHSGPAPISSYMRARSAPSNSGASHAAQRDDTFSSATERVVAAFRGRTIHGFQVQLPEGYTGLVLRSSGEHADAAINSSAKPRQRATRGKQASRAGMDEQEEVQARFVAIEDHEPSRSLVPDAQFSSFILWNADIPVDDGRDEYLRSLSEWVKLSAQVR
jgi:hypothetical protein